jgi:DNA primase
MLRKSLAELAGVSQAELEDLYQIQPIRKPTKALPRLKRNPPSLVRQMLQFLLVQPQLAQGVVFDQKGREGEELTLAVLLEFLAEHPHLKDAAPLIEHFRGTAHEARIRDAAAEVMQWEDLFDAEEIAQEFAGALAQLKWQAKQREIDALLALSRSQGLTAAQKEQLQQLLLRRE